MFSVLGIDEGEQIVIESPEGKKRLRALKISEKMEIERQAMRVDIKQSGIVFGWHFWGLARIDGSENVIFLRYL